MNYSFIWKIRPAQRAGSKLVVNIDSVNNLKLLYSIHLLHNPIVNLTFDIISLNKRQIYLSFSSSFNLSALNNSINQFTEIYVFGDRKNMNFKNIFNQKEYLNSSKSIVKYYKTANLITLTNLFELDCLQTINFMKQRIHFNLFLNQQVDKFLSKCQKLDL